MKSLSNREQQERRWPRLSRFGHGSSTRHAERSGPHLSLRVRGRPRSGFNRTFITTDPSASVARITNSTSPNNLQTERWWESLALILQLASTGRETFLAPEENNRHIRAFRCPPAVTDYRGNLVIPVCICSISPCIPDHTKDGWSRYSV